MKNNENLAKTQKNQAIPASDKNNTSAREENKSQEKGKKKDAVPIEAEETKSKNQGSENRKPQFGK